MSVEDNGLVDRKVTLLIAAGAAMAANCEPCLNKVVPDLIEAGVAEADIRAAVEIGQFVKDRPAALMKQAADALAGTRLSGGREAAGCAAQAVGQATPRPGRLSRTVMRRRRVTVDLLITNQLPLRP